MSRFILFENIEPSLNNVRISVVSFKNNCNKIFFLLFELILNVLYYEILLEENLLFMNKREPIP